MTYKIHYELKGGYEDSFVITAITIQEIQKLAAVELEKRGAINPWSEEIT